MRPQRGVPHPLGRPRCAPAPHRPQAAPPPRGRGGDPQLRDHAPARRPGPRPDHAQRPGRIARGRCPAHARQLGSHPPGPLPGGGAIGTNPHRGRHHPHLTRRTPPLDEAGLPAPSGLASSTTPSVSAGTLPGVEEASGNHVVRTESSCLAEAITFSRALAANSPGAMRARSRKNLAPVPGDRRHCAGGRSGGAQWVRAVLCADSLLAGLGAACQSGSARKRRLLKDQHDRDNQQHGAECD
jgi:hypothetical protein